MAILDAPQLLSETDGTNASSCGVCRMSIAVDSLPTQAADDRQLAANVRNALLATGRASFRAIEVAAENGGVTLDGVAPCFFIKQIAQTISLKTPGVERVVNRLRVVTTDVCVH